MKQNEIFPHLHWQDLSLSILYYVHEKETMPSDHCHAFYELVLVREGQAMHFMNGELARIRAGNIFLVPPGKMHGYRDALAALHHHAFHHRLAAHRGAAPVPVAGEPVF